jgi:hypothetical protein
MMKDGQDTQDSGGRRDFLGRIAAVGAGAAAVSLPSWLGAATPSSSDEDHWLDKLSGKYRQVFDVYKPDEGWGLAYARTFLATQGPNPDAGAVVVLRHFGFPLALTDDVWAKYKIGQSVGINDPETKAPAVRNPFLRPKPGVLLVDDMAVDVLLSKGVIFGGCNVALHVLSGKLSGNAGVTPEVALKEWTAAVIPGITIIPSGVWGVNRAQVKGCSYCAAG